jgi:tyrosyl-tRNA synthetase
VILYHGPEAAEAAEAAFDAGVRARAGVATGTGEAPDAQVRTEPFTPLAIPEGAVHDGKIWVIALLSDAGVVRSRGEARRLVSQGAVRLDGRQVDSIDQSWTPAELHGRLLTVGRRSPVLLQAPGS